MNNLKELRSIWDMNNGHSLPSDAVHILAKDLLVFIIKFIQICESITKMNHEAPTRLLVNNLHDLQSSYYVC